MDTKTAKRMKREEAAAALGLSVVRMSWGCWSIQDASGRVLARLGMDAVDPWLDGYRVAKETP